MGVGDIGKLQGPQASGQMGSAGVLQRLHGPRHDSPDVISRALAMCCVEIHRDFFARIGCVCRASTANVSRMVAIGRIPIAIASFLKHREAGCLNVSVGGIESGTVSTLRFPVAQRGVGSWCRLHGRSVHALADVFSRALNRRIRGEASVPFCWSLALALRVSLNVLDALFSVNACMQAGSPLR